MHEVKVTADLEQWRALLRRLPRCQGCGRPAQVRLRESSTSFCVCAGCATERPGARVEQLEHTEALDAITNAIAGSD